MKPTIKPNVLTTAIVMLLMVVGILGTIFIKYVL